MNIDQTQERSRGLGLALCGQFDNNITAEDTDTLGSVSRACPRSQAWEIM